ncbi:hypothetical protein DVH24_033903 [Malus domestica]|uniref:Uncharacterized protein n=1 Tax=Malus domestica TaxID=3750 RepID=A0A498KP22_MALDO|nr:hypothetical protein DVH24_033903 [Malus domestica]
MIKIGFSHFSTILHQTSFVTSRPEVHHIPGPLHHRSTILSALSPDHTLMVLFLGTHTRTSQWVTHHGNAFTRYSLNFGVSMEPEDSELPKGLVLIKNVEETTNRFCFHTLDEFKYRNDS